MRRIGAGGDGAGVTGGGRGDCSDTRARAAATDGCAARPKPRTRSPERPGPPRPKAGDCSARLAPAPPAGRRPAPATRPDAAATGRVPASPEPGPAPGAEGAAATAGRARGPFPSRTARARPRGPPKCPARCPTRMTWPGCEEEAWRQVSTCTSQGREPLFGPTPCSRSTRLFSFPGRRLDTVLGDLAPRN